MGAVSPSKTVLPSTAPEWSKLMGPEDQRRLAPSQGDAESNCAIPWVELFTTHVIRLNGLSQAFHEPMPHGQESQTMPTDEKPEGLPSRLSKICMASLEVVHGRTFFMVDKCGRAGSGTLGWIQPNLNLRTIRDHRTTLHSKQNLTFFGF